MCVCASKSTLVFRCIIVRRFPLNYGNENVCRCVQAPTDNELKREKIVAVFPFSFFLIREFFPCVCVGRGRSKTKETKKKKKKSEDKQ